MFKKAKESVGIDYDDVDVQREIFGFDDAGIEREMANAVSDNIVNYDLKYPYPKDSSNESIVAGAPSPLQVKTMESIGIICPAEKEIIDTLSKNKNGVVEFENYRPKQPMCLTLKPGNAHCVFIQGGKGPGILTVKHVIQDSKGLRIPNTLLEIWFYANGGFQYTTLVHSDDFQLCKNDDLCFVSINNLKDRHFIFGMKPVKKAIGTRIGDAVVMLCGNFSTEVKDKDGHIVQRSDPHSQGFRIVSGTIPSNDRSQTWTTIGVSGSPVFVGDEMVGLHVAGWNNPNIPNSFVPITRIEAFLNLC